MSNTEVIAHHLADLIGLLHDDANAGHDHALLAACAPEDLGTIDHSGTRLCDLCRARARDLMDISARMADAGMNRSDVRLLLHHACAALDEADLWAGLAVSARHFKAAMG